MDKLSNSDVARLLAQWNAGDDAALAALIPQVYDELRSLAQRHLRRERPDHTIQPTALVHEAFLRLSNQKLVQWQNREHFIGLASHLMRRILVDHARARSASKRGDGMPRISLEDLVAPVCTRLGWKSNLPLEPLLRQVGLVPEITTKVNLFNGWRLIKCVNPK